MSEQQNARVETPYRQAVLFALKPEPPPLGSITDHTPAYLLPLAGKCLADRMLGRLADIGVSEVFILIQGDSNAGAAFFEDGTRWGVNIQLIDVRSPEQAVERLKVINLEPPFLLGDLYRFPVLDETSLKELSDAGTALVTHSDGEPTGWAALASDALETCRAAENPDKLFDILAATTNHRVMEANVLSCVSARDLLLSLDVLLGNKVNSQVVSGASGDPGLWIGAGSVIHPTVDLAPPVWIGENCRIGRRTQLGPNVTISDNCVLGERSIITRTCVLPGTSIGDELELDETVADRNYLAYADAGQTVAIPDPFLIAPNKPLAVASMLGAFLGRLLALLLLPPTLPALALVWLTGLACGQRRPIEVVECVRLPAPTDPMLWKTFGNRRWAAGAHRGWNALRDTRILKVLAAIPNIALGRLHWVGLAPRTVEETMALSEDWKMLYLGSKPGLFQLAEIDQRHIGESSEDQQFSSEAFYAASQSVRQDMRIVLRGLFSPRPRHAPADQTAILTLSTGDTAIDQLHDFLHHELNSRSVSKVKTEAIITAAHEAMTNVIKHAYDLKPGLPVQLHLRGDAERVELELFDKGKEFKPETIAKPDFSEAASGGFGWHLINSIADQVGASRLNGWNQLTLVFDHSPEGETQDEY